jgi:SAM-dependent methyltransferase
MPITEPFERLTGRYDHWFERHADAYVAELLAVRALLPLGGESLEVGVGTGRFAGPLGVGWGIDPAAAVLPYARRRGVVPVRGAAEALPFAAASFDSVLVVTTVCFVDDVAAHLEEVRRVLKPGGAVVVGLIDRDSPLGRIYRQRQAESPFYAPAHFLSSAELGEALASAGLTADGWAQTLFEDGSSEMGPQPTRWGTGAGSFVVARARRS